VFGIVPGLITARLTGLLGGLVVAPLVMRAMVRFDAYRVPLRLSWPRALFISATAYFLLFGPLIVVPTTVLLEFSTASNTLVPVLLWAGAWFAVAFIAASMVVSAVLNLSFRQAVSWWGVAFAASVVVSWVGALVLVLLYRYLVLPQLTDFY